MRLSAYCLSLQTQHQHIDYTSFPKCLVKGWITPPPPPVFFKGGGRGEGSGGREMSLLEFIYLSFSSTLLHGRLFTFKKKSRQKSDPVFKLDQKINFTFPPFPYFSERIFSQGVKITRMFGLVSYITLTRSADISEEVCERGYSKLEVINI